MSKTVLVAWLSGVAAAVFALMLVSGMVVSGGSLWPSLEDDRPTVAEVSSQLHSDPASVERVRAFLESGDQSEVPTSGCLVLR